MRQKNRRLLMVIVVCGFGSVLANSEMSSLDYSVADKTDRTYDLEYGQKTGFIACTLKLSIEKSDQDPNREGDQEDLFDLTFTYADFRCWYEDQSILRTVSDEIGASGIDEFTFDATIDKFGNLISSNLSERLKIIEGKGDTQKHFAATRIAPMVACAWVCIIPKLSDIKDGRLVQHDVRDWTPLGRDYVLAGLAGANSGARFHVRAGKDRLRELILWWDATEIMESKEHGSDCDVTYRTQFEFGYDFEQKAVTRGSVKWTTMFGDKDADEQPEPVFFKAVLQK